MSQWAGDWAGRWCGSGPLAPSGHAHARLSQWRTGDPASRVVVGVVVVVFVIRPHSQTTVVVVTGGMWCGGGGGRRGRAEAIQANQPGGVGLSDVAVCV